MGPDFFLSFHRGTFPHLVLISDKSTTSGELRSREPHFLWGQLSILTTINGKPQCFERGLIDIGDQRQIDFKGLDPRICEIDWIRVRAGA